MIQDLTLDELQAELLRRGVSSELRGSGASAFLFAEHLGKAIEVSKHECQFWVEFWEANPDEYAPPVKEDFFANYVDAAQNISAWLLS